MSNLSCENGRPMKTEKKEKKFCPVTLEPELEEIAALWGVNKRFEMAKKFRRWGRQLRISGFIMLHASHPGPKRPALQSVGPRKAARN